MKPNTTIWLLCESIGKPESTLKMQCTVREAIKAQTEWLLGTYMGQKIRITYARDEAELGADRRSAAKSDVMADLESILNGALDEMEENHGHS